MRVCLSACAFAPHLRPSLRPCWPLARRLDRSSVSAAISALPACRVWCAGFAGITPAGRLIVADKQLTPLPALPRMAKATKPASIPCECGCGLLTKSRFFPGHDSRLRGWCLRVERKLITLDQVPDGPNGGERAAVKRELAKRAKEAGAAK